MKPKSLLFAMLLGTMTAGANAQYWAPLGNGFFGGTGGSRVVFGDTVWDRLIVGSNHKWMFVDEDTLTIAGVSLWDGHTWDTLPSRIQDVSNVNSNICAPVLEFMRYQGQLYANGYFGFITPDSTVNESFARWNNENLRWEALECVHPFMNGIGMISMVPPTDTLYFTGYRDSMCGYPQSCVFKYDGNEFHPFEPFDAWQGYSGDYVGYVFWFQNQLYMTGLLHNSITNTTHGFLRYNGSTWEPVLGFETPAPIKDVLIHENKLYVCGYFFTDTGAPGNMVTVFDGSGWSDMGGGLREALPNGTLGVALDLHEWNGDIYVAGQFNYAGGVYAENVARWNGQQWCGMGGHYATQTPGSTVYSLTTWRDSLYIAGGFITIDGDSLNRIAKWLGEVQNCSPPVGVQEISSSDGMIPMLLNGEGQWRIELPSAIEELRVYDIQGRLLRQEHALTDRTLILDLASHPSGIYLIECLTRNGLRSRAKLYRP